MYPSEYDRAYDELYSGYNSRFRWVASDMLPAEEYEGYGEVV